jgi:hypothetical protein
LVDDFYYLKFSFDFENEERNRILSTFCLFSKKNEIIGNCEIVIVNKEDAEKEIIECEKNFNFLENTKKI